eukprot:CAMPEP_0197028826 /NCGR_PEP_ID=MMETSP1384-20130603/8423_1 /TAXON_ID=29189 /ORGANISM="Ammonia sp." /LENGTH=448 /DNA_ID=CAMNT_0042457887 /DNA_START=8 /DNA_END=1354 /DNA_ORIENTATION=+
MAQPVYTQEQSSMSMNEEFFVLWKKYNKCIDNISTTDNEMKLCIESCYMLKKRVAKAALFSLNEDIDDINTEYLKFGLLSHFLSELYTNRNEGKRTLSLRYSDEMGKIFIHQCDNWTLLEKQHREIFERGFGDDAKQKLNPFQARTEEVQNFKLQKRIKHKIDQLLKKDSYNKHQNAETKWKLFAEDDDERDFWLQQYQIAILKTLKTLKQNAFERPLSEKWEKEQEAKKEQHKFQHESQTETDEQKTNHKAQVFNWEPRQIGGDNDKAQKQSGKGPKVWSVDADGKTSAFNNLEEMKYHLDRSIDEKVHLRTDRKLIFRDPNPWTYTPEQAAQLGLLSEIPKDYFAKQQEKKRMEVLNQRHLERYGKPLGYDVNNDDGSELNPGQVEYHRKGKVTTFTMDDMPNDPKDNQEVEDMTEEEYEQWIRDERGWANWKDDNEKGAGNPYYH